MLTVAVALTWGAVAEETVMGVPPGSEGDDGAGQAGAFGGEDDAVAVHALPDAGADQFGAALVEGVDEGAGEVLVAAGVSLGGGRSVR